MERLRGFLSGRVAWVLLALVAIAVLAIGAYHPAAPTETQRIANLEDLLKCPACADASLAQSETVEANQLKATIVTWVHQGLSDRAIEDRVVATYGPEELLRPSDPALWIVPSVVVAVAVSVLGLYLFHHRASSGGGTGSDEELVEALLRARAAGPEEAVEDV